ncbi:Cof-type HAD-IIB family hydrolase [Paucilactobacillus sp. N302-9]
MSIKMIAVDMDGTFLRDDNTYDQQRFNAQFEKLRALGIHFVAASGSQLQRLRNQFDGIKDQMDFVSENGSVVYSNNQIVSVEGLTDELLKKIQAMIGQHFRLPIASTTITGLKSAYLDASEPDELFDLKSRYYNSLARVDNILDLTAKKVNDTLIKVGISFAPADDLEQRMQQVKTLLPPQLESLSSGFNTELIGLAGVTKQTGIAKLQRQYGIQADEIMTFGDNENDLSMLKMTPNGYAMANAGQEILNQVHHVAPNNNQDGVLDIIDNVLNDLK